MSAFGLLAQQPQAKKSAQGGHLGWFGAAFREGSKGDSVPGRFLCAVGGYHLGLFFVAMCTMFQVNHSWWFGLVIEPVALVERNWETPP